jgi:hypothetical protein
MNDGGTIQQFSLKDDIPINRDSISSFQNFGVTNFDTLGSSYLTIFQCTTLEGWSNIMEMIEDGYNVYLAAGMFISCLIICTYLMHNLTIAVMLEKYVRGSKRNTMKSQKEHDKQEDQRMIDKNNYVKNLKQIENKKVFE